MAFPAANLEQLTSYGVNWRSYSEQYLDSLGPFRDGVLAILACIAQQEKTRISERTIAGLQKARRKGRIGGRPKQVVDVQKIQSLRAQGIPWPAIAQKLGVSIATLERRVRGAEGRTAHEDQQAHRPEARSQDGTIQAQA